MNKLFTIIIFLAVSPAYSQVWVDSYYRNDGTRVEGHYRSEPDVIKENNWSHPSNRTQSYDPVPNREETTYHRDRRDFYDRHKDVHEDNYNDYLDRQDEAREANRSPDPVAPPPSSINVDRPGRIQQVEPQPTARYQNYGTNLNYEYLVSLFALIFSPVATVFIAQYYRNKSSAPRQPARARAGSRETLQCPECGARTALGPTQCPKCDGLFF